MKGTLCEHEALELVRLGNDLATVIRYVPDYQFGPIAVEVGGLISAVAALHESLLHGDGKEAQARSAKLMPERKSLARAIAKAEAIQRGDAGWL